MGNSKLADDLKKNIQDLEKLNTRAAEAAAKTKTTLQEIETRLKESGNFKKKKD